MHKFIFIALMAAGAGYWFRLEKPPKASVVLQPALLPTLAPKPLRSDAHYEHQQLENFAFIDSVRPFHWAADTFVLNVQHGAVSGQIRNLGPDQREVSISFDLYNQQGEVTGRAIDIVFGLKHGEVWSFHAITTGSTAPAKVEFSGIETF